MEHPESKNLGGEDKISLEEGETPREYLSMTKCQSFDMTVTGSGVVMPR